MQKTTNLELSKARLRWQKITKFCGESLLFALTCASMATLFFIFIFIIKDALPFFKTQSLKDFLFTDSWYPAANPGEFGALSCFYGTFMVTIGASIVAVPFGLLAAVCLSDVLPFGVRQVAKPIIELLAAIPSVAFGFFALVILAPILQNHGGSILQFGCYFIAVPFLLIIVYLLFGLLSDKSFFQNNAKILKISLATFTIFCFGGIIVFANFLGTLQIHSGTNAFNVSLILGIMALPTIVSVAEDSLQACGRDLREGSYALGATRAETMVKVIFPAASGGIIAAVILGIMRAIGETMVVWMASGNTAAIPKPFYNFFAPVRTLTATIAGDMGEAARNTPRYHVLFAMALALLIITFAMNLFSQKIVNHQRKKLSK